ncbi:alpha/beta hydrolase [Oscillospiraceae bacterium MB08-C2-2]|nr:alpha/beta hydrolase [Oscillospiraceae bacterium MB08-C2-2]
MPTESFIQLSDGSRIHLDTYGQTEPKATFVLFHGVGGNGRLLSFLAVPLHASGYEVICPDLPLYGYTQCTGTVTYNSWVTAGTEIAEHLIKRGKRVFLFGLSAGGLLAYQIACNVPSVCGVLATCILDQRQREITEKTSSHPLLVKLLPAASIIARIFPNIKIPMKWVANMKAIVNSPELARLLMADKRASGAWVSLAFLNTMLNPEIIQEPEQFSLPFALLHPQEDRWTDLSLSKLFYDKLAGEKELHILKEAGHFPIEEAGWKLLVENSIRFIEKYR